MKKEKPKQHRHYGCHVSSAGGLVNAIKTAKLLQINTIQLHPSPPQRWNLQPFREGIEEEFMQAREDSEVEKVFFHGIYLINLATPLLENLQRSEQSLIHYLSLNSRIKGDGVIFHVGSLKDEENEARGMKKVGDAISRILDGSPQDSRLILEVAAGSGKIIGDRLEELAQIAAQVDAPNRLGFALDSQHLWASGYNLVEELDKFASDAAQIMGLKHIWAIHLNDSKTECGSRKDRHENLGDGLIGYNTLQSFFQHPSFEEIPFILETPNMREIETAKRDVAILNKWAGN